MKKIFTILFSFVLLCGLSSPVFANDIKVVDDADVLSDSEEKQLDSLIRDYISFSGYDMVICFMDDDSTDSTIEAYADDYFDYNGYGIGNDRDGIILYVNVSERVLTITTRGASSIDTYTDQAISDLYDATVNGMSSDWYSGAESFVNKAKYIVSYYDFYHAPETAETLSKADIALDAAGIAFLPALFVALVVFFILYKQLKNTSIKKTAHQYVTNADVDVFRSGEVYLYTSRSVRRIERNDSHSSSGGGHSSTHISSSGASHGGGGSRHF